MATAMTLLVFLLTVAPVATSTAAAGCKGQDGEERAVRQAGSSARRAPKPEQVIREECKEKGGHRVRQRAAAGGGSRPNFEQTACGLYARGMHAWWLDPCVLRALCTDQ